MPSYEDKAETDLWETVARWNQAGCDPVRIEKEYDTGKLVGWSIANASSRVAWEKPRPRRQVWLPGFQAHVTFGALVAFAILLGTGALGPLVAFMLLSWTALFMAFPWTTLFMAFPKEHR